MSRVVQAVEKSPETRLERFRRRIRERYSVRFHMMLILMATAMTGVLASKTLLWFGIGSVKARYPINVAIAYLVFLILIRIWILYVRAASDGPDLAIDGDDVSDVVSGFGGGGSGEPSAPAASFVSTSSSGKPSGSGSGFSFDFDLDGDGAVILIVLGVLILVILSGGAYLVWIAPEILGEAAFNAVLASSLVGVTTRLEREGWVEGVVRKTIIPFGIVFAVTMALAYAVVKTCPAASTVREALSCPAYNK